MNIRVVRNAYPFIAAGTGAAGVFIIMGIVTDYPSITSAGILCAAATAFIIFFFRDPERHSDAVSDAVLSPADGRVVSIVREAEPVYLRSETIRISIFLSVFDVHVNRIPVDGTVKMHEYRQGSFFAAFREKASSQNEQTFVGIENNRAKVAYKQIAGVLARRIISTVREGQQVTRGDRCGHIMFGSRVDLLLPPESHVDVIIGQRVRGGETQIGRLIEL